MDNKYQVYRQIRFNRTYRTLGKMSLWRVILGIALLVLVLLISGVVSQYFAARGHFRTAEVLMIYPGWMEKYKPETKDFIEAGVIYQDGDYAAAAEAFGSIEGVDAAVSMESASYAKLASQLFSQGDAEGAFEAVEKVDYSLLGEDTEEFIGLCTELEAHFSASSDPADGEKGEYLQGVIAAAAAPAE